jgi:hypothetical protein
MNVANKTQDVNRVIFMAQCGLTKKAEPRRAGDIERRKPSRQTIGSNRRWLRRLVRPRIVSLHKNIRQKSVLAQPASELTTNSRSCEAKTIEKLNSLPNLPKNFAAQNLRLPT